ncbi:MAG: hypothetical protein DMF69_03470 [Acidobacteria bacterium]|nr:MAG: hypothetical protein DMF69_03470 [Acidobacteriota bacterium]
MGLFDKMFGRGATDAEQQQGAQQRFNELKQRYQTVLFKTTSSSSKESLLQKKRRISFGIRSNS